MADTSVAPPRTAGIYEIVNTVNGKRYVGSAINLARRFCEHRRTLKAGNHSNAKLQAAWGKYGAESFAFSVLRLCLPGECVRLEQVEIDGTKPAYNIAPIAGSVLGLKKTQEQIQKTVAHNTGRPLSLEHRAKLSAALVGRKLPAETIEKLSAAKRGKAQSAATREKLSIANTGKTMSAETRERMRAAQQKRQLTKPTFGRKWSDAERLAASERMMANNQFRGKPRSEETKAKLSAAHTGKKLSETHRQAMRDGHARRRAGTLGST